MIKDALIRAVSIMFATYCRSESNLLEQGKESSILVDTVTFSIDIVKEAEK